MLAPFGGSGWSPSPVRPGVRFRAKTSSEIRGKIISAAGGIVGRRPITHTPLPDAVLPQQERQLRLRKSLATEGALSKRRHFGPDGVARAVLALAERRNEFRRRPACAPISCEQVTEVEQELDTGSEFFAGLRRIHHPPCVLHALPPRRPGGVGQDEERCQFVLGAIVDFSGNDVGLDLVLVRLLDFGDELLKTREIVLRVACETAGELGTQPLRSHRDLGLLLFAARHVRR